MFDFVIWDFDGTLFDTYPLIVETYINELALLGIKESDERVERLVRTSFGTLHRYLSESYGLGSEFWEKCSNSRRGEEQKRAFAFKGAFGLLSDIIALGGRNAIYTHRGASTFSLLEKAGMKNLFCDFVTEADNFPPKPSPDAVEALIARNGASTERAIMVGDREIDVGSGINAGINACLFRALSFENTEANFTARDYAELRKIILG